MTLVPFPAPVSVIPEADIPTPICKVAVPAPPPEGQSLKTPL